jgi:hypothetical protein
VRLRRKTLLALIWTLLVLYPNPLLLTESVYRLFNPPVGSEHLLFVEKWEQMNRLPSNPQKIEEFVVRYVKYDYDFNIYGVPWYFPTPAEVVEKRKGDCKSRAILLAAIFEEKGVPYSFHISPVHFWVDYPGKEENEFTKKYENPKTAIFSDGRWKLPELVDLKTYYDSWKAVLWDSMPTIRKVLLLGGWILIFSWDRLMSMKRGGGEERGEMRR